MKDYIHGKISDTSLDYAVSQLIEQLPQVNSIAVRSIDSTVAAEGLQKIMTSCHISCRQVNGNILLSRSSEGVKKFV